MNPFLEFALVVFGLAAIIGTGYIIGLIISAIDDL